MSDYRLLMIRAINVLQRADSNTAFGLADALAKLVEDPTNDTKADLLIQELDLQKELIGWSKEGRE